jgi:hypothetical protein
MPATITSIIGDSGLKAGDAMRDVKGDAIANSVVVGPSAWAMTEDGSLTIERYAVITGETTRIEIGHEGAAALSRLLGPDEIHVATFDGSTISTHRSAAGAARAAIDHMYQRMERLGSSKLTRQDAAQISAVLDDRGGIDLQMRHDLGAAVPGMAVERIHAIAMGVSGCYEIRNAALLD